MAYRDLARIYTDLGKGPDDKSVPPDHVLSLLLLFSEQCIAADMDGPEFVRLVNEIEKDRRAFAKLDPKNFAIHLVYPKMPPKYVEPLKARMRPIGVAKESAPTTNENDVCTDRAGTPVYMRLNSESKSFKVDDETTWWRSYCFKDGENCAYYHVQFTNTINVELEFLRLKAEFKKQRPNKSKAEADMATFKKTCVVFRALKYYHTTQPFLGAKSIKDRAAALKVPTNVFPKDWLLAGLDEVDLAADTFRPWRGNGPEPKVKDYVSIDAMYRIKAAMGKNYLTVHDNEGRSLKMDKALFRYYQRLGPGQNLDPRDVVGEIIDEIENEEGEVDDSDA